MLNAFWKVCGLCAVFISACDLQPKIASIPDSIGIFISERYPALLADPNTQPEIYNSAVTDYGVYASPELYGSYNDKDYLVYASVDDYVLLPSKEQAKPKSSDYLIVPEYKNEPKIQESKQNYIVVAAGDTLYSLARSYNMTVDELAKINNLSRPYTLSVGQRLSTTKSGATINHEPQIVQTVKKTETPKDLIKPNTTKRVDLQEITVVAGDTLYSLSRKYEIPVNDLAVMNKLSAPFTLSVDQKIKVPKLDSVAVRSDSVVVAQKPEKQSYTAVEKTQKTKISSDPKKQLPKISARSNAKFSWPVRGKILSDYGAKNKGLFNDGINISAPIGTVVKAAENGVVAYAGNEVKGMGNLVIIQHSDGWMTVYAHLDSMSVKRGTKVSVGQSIGKLGQTGKVDKPQLHFEIRKGTKAFNPTQYLKK